EAGCDEVDGPWHIPMGQPPTPKDFFETHNVPRGVGQAAGLPSNLMQASGLHHLLSCRQRFIEFHNQGLQLTAAWGWPLACPLISGSPAACTPFNEGLLLTATWGRPLACRLTPSRPAACTTFYHAASASLSSITRVCC